jgi:hypothetical protein
MPEKLIKSVYTVLSNKFFDNDVTTNTDNQSHTIEFLLPSWFTTWSGKKIIKVYGCSFVYLRNQLISNKYQYQFISVHSNIAVNDNTVLNCKYINELTPDYKSDSQYYDYLITCNNYYSPKIYDVTNSDLKSIKINFTDAFGDVIKLKYNTTETVEDAAGVSVTEKVGYRSAFRMECEWAIIAEK